MPNNEILQQLRSHANQILSACLAAADPEQAVRRFVRVDGSQLMVEPNYSIDLSRVRRVMLVGAGKASAPMAKALEELLGDRIETGLICVKYGHGLALKQIQVMEGGHPVPDRSGEAATRKIMELLGSAGADDLVISCISGGGSALLPAPAEGITLRQKQDLTRGLLAVGANIQEINAVRKHLSASKGGSLMRIAHPATVVNLMLSDVVGDDPATIASGPFVPDPSTFSEALAIVHKYGIDREVDPAVRQRLQGGAEGKIPETPKAGDPIFERARNVIVGSNILCLVAGKEKAEALGYTTLVLSSTIEGTTSEAAGFHAALAREVVATGHPVQPPACLLSGGETIVVVTGEGLGGRNQEFALSLVREAARLPGVVFLSAGSDGTDGPTDAAGAVVDSRTLQRAVSMSLDPDKFLQNNDSYHFFRELNDLVITGPTRTNVMDIRVLLVSD